jgi:hypothetical protein
MSGRVPMMPVLRVVVGRIAGAGAGKESASEKQSAEVPLPKTANPFRAQSSGAGRFQFNQFQTAAAPRKLNLFMHGFSFRETRAAF